MRTKRTPSGTLKGYKKKPKVTPKPKTKMAGLQGQKAAKPAKPKPRTSGASQGATAASGLMGKKKKKNFYGSA